MPTRGKSRSRAAPAEAEALPLRHVSSAPELEALCVHLAECTRFGIDTEFVGERSYLPRVELVQVATEREIALIDCQSVTDLAPLERVLADATIEKVLHAGQQDLEIFAQRSGRVPHPIFDTQVAAAMAGYGAQPGYAALVERLLGVTLHKTETLTDWSQRPLTEAQIRYAADDVRYLLPLHDRLRERLESLGRSAWLRQELEQIEHVRPAAPEPEEAHLRVRGRGSLRGRSLAVLRELAAWRERKARGLDRPRSALVRDNLLVEIARRAPTAPEALRGLRALRSREILRWAPEVVAAVQRGLECPREEWPEAVESRRKSPPPGVVELLLAVLRARADEAHIASAMLATSAGIETLVQDHLAGHAADHPLMHGWRAELAGDTLRAILEGRLAATVGKDGKLQLADRE